MNTQHPTATPAGADIAPFVPLVQRLARQLRARLPASVEFDDLVQAGLIGLSDALPRFDAAHGVPFEAYAAQRIRGAMLDELRAADSASRDDRRQQRRIDAAVQRLEQRFGRSPLAGEIAHELGMPLAEYHQLRTKVHNTGLMHLEDLGADFLDHYAVPEHADPLALLTDQRLRRALADAIGRLPERELLVMSLIYEQDMQMQEVAAVLGVTPSRISQVHSQAVTRLRTRLAPTPPGQHRRTSSGRPHAATTTPTPHTGA